MAPICRNWQNAYIISLSKGLDALEGQAAAKASARGVMYWLEATKLFNAFFGLGPLTLPRVRWG
jgi:hypothetical protein